VCRAIELNQLPKEIACVVIHDFCLLSSNCTSTRRPFKMCISFILVCRVQRGLLLLHRLVDACCLLELADFKTGQLKHRVSTPHELGIGTLEVYVDPDPLSTVVYVKFSSPTVIGTIYRCVSTLS
jgi:hypothetical protein